MQLADHHGTLPGHFSPALLILRRLFLGPSDSYVDRNSAPGTRVFNHLPVTPDRSWLGPGLGQGWMQRGAVRERTAADFTEVTAPLPPVLGERQGCSCRPCAGTGRRGPFLHLLPGQGRGSRSAALSRRRPSRGSARSGGGALPPRGKRGRDGEPHLLQGPTQSQAGRPRGGAAGSLGPRGSGRAARAGGRRALRPRHLPRRRPPPPARAIPAGPGASGSRGSSSSSSSASLPPPGPPGSSPEVRGRSPPRSPPPDTPIPAPGGSIPPAPPAAGRGGLAARSIPGPRTRYLAAAPAAAAAAEPARAEVTSSRSTPSVTDTRGRPARPGPPAAAALPETKKPGV